MSVPITTVLLKDPDSILPFKMDWSAWLTGEGDTGASIVCSVAPVGELAVVTNPAPSLLNGVATFWLENGTAGKAYRVTVELTTTGGRVDQRTGVVRVTER